MHYHNIILFFEPALVLVDLAFERFDREIDRLLETFAPALGHQVVSRNMEVDPIARSTKRSSLSILCSTNSTNFLSASNFTD